MLEEILGASRIPMEQREASRKNGFPVLQRQSVNCLRKIFLWKNKVFFEKYLETRKGKPVSHCCAYGVFCAPRDRRGGNTLSLSLCPDLCNGDKLCKNHSAEPECGQKLLCGCYGEFEEILSYISDCTEDDLCLSAPGFDIRGIQHEKLYSRLYMS